MKKAYNFSKGKRGVVVPALKGKTRITIRINDDILEFTQAGMPIRLEGFLES